MQFLLKTSCQKVRPTRNINSRDLGLFWTCTNGLNLVKKSSGSFQAGGETYAHGCHLIPAGQGKGWSFLHDCCWVLIERLASVVCFHLHSRTGSRSQPSRNQTCYLLQHACSFNADFITSYCTGALLMQISLPVTVQWRFNADFMNLLQHRCSFNADFINLLLYRCSLIQSSLIFCSTGALLMQISLTCYSTGALLMQISLTSYGTGALFMQISYTFCVNLEQVG